MNRYKIVITKPAKDDLTEIARYVAEEVLAPTIAVKLIDKIGNAIIELGKMPYRHPLVSDEELSAEGIRRMPVDNYLVFYLVSERIKTVKVVRILYNRRDWIKLL